MLAILALQPEAYGVAIQRALASRMGRQLSFGAIYTTLDRLEGKGLISSHYGEPTPNRGGRAKKFFSVEALGIDALNADRRTTEALWAMKPLRGSR